MIFRVLKLGTGWIETLHFTLLTSLSFIKKRHRSICHIYCNTIFINRLNYGNYECTKLGMPFWVQNIIRIMFAKNRLHLLLKMLPKCFGLFLMARRIDKKASYRSSSFEQGCNAVLTSERLTPECVYDSKKHEEIS